MDRSNPIPTPTPVLNSSSQTNPILAAIESSRVAKAAFAATASTTAATPTSTASTPATATTAATKKESLSPFQSLGPSQIVLQAPSSSTSSSTGSTSGGIQPPPRFIGNPIYPIWRRGPQAYAPAWFYSALIWLEQSFYDASNTRQQFSSYLIGSDVDPYSALGSTRLFAITLADGRNSGFNLVVAADSDSLALTTAASADNSTVYPDTDAGILRLYNDLAASPTFAAATHVYIPARMDLRGNDLDALLSTGYDPATGLRACVLGSAVAQVVPLGDFTATHNEQIYDPTPKIVPIVPAALVYDITTNNTVGARTFTLPVYYVRDQLVAGTYYVSKLGGVSPSGADGGQTVVFPGGPGWSGQGAATQLTLQGEASSSAGGSVWVGSSSSSVVFTTYNFSTATVVTTLPPSTPLGAQVLQGVTSLTCTASPLSLAFSTQQIVGYYRPTSWDSCLGMPMWDFGVANGSFTVGTLSDEGILTPDLIYDPSTPFLNGGTLQKVVSALQNAKYLFSPDRVVGMLENAISAGKQEGDGGVGLSVTTAALGFAPTQPPAGPVLDSLAVPVAATVTTTPPPIYIPRRSDTLEAVSASSHTGSESSNDGKRPILTPMASYQGSSAGRKVSRIAKEKMINLENQLPIGAGGNAPKITKFSPTTVQVGLTASIPQEALSGTGITSIESGTVFSTLDIGSGAALEAMGTVATVYNLSSSRAYPPVKLTITTIGADSFKEGIYYVLSLTGTALTIRGSDLSSLTDEVSSTADSTHTYVGAIVYTTSTTTITLYPKLPLSLTPPAVGTYEVLQGMRYSVRLTIGDGSCRLDIIDDTQATVASNIPMKTPATTDGSEPQMHDLYFGSFLGGASEMTVWAVPIFLNLTAGQLQGASFNGSMTLAAQADGVPSYQLQYTDSSLFIYSNINVDNNAVGSVSGSNVYLASAVINSTPDIVDSPASFAPCKLLSGLVQQVKMGTQMQYVFIPEDDSVLIGKTRYMLSVINLKDFNLDLTQRPYIPVYWSQSQYWQFANRHNPYLGVGYAGPATQAERISKAQADIASIGVATATAGEPMQMYLDTGASGMIVWPIWQFPYVNDSQSVDQNQLKTITSTILQILDTTFPPVKPFVPGPLDEDRITIPGLLTQNNPYTAGTTTTSPTTAVTTDIASTKTMFVEQDIIQTPQLSGQQVANLNSSSASASSVPSNLSTQLSVNAKTQQISAANVAATKNLAPVVNVTQAHPVTEDFAITSQPRFLRKFFPPVYGFSVFNPGTGEAYIIELIDADSGAPTQYPISPPGSSPSYDPYYVRVVFLNTLTAYNMSIVVPSMVHDQYGHFATQETEYTNLHSGTDELGLGYMYSLYDTSNNFDSITLTQYPPPPPGMFESLAASQLKVFTNVPYSTPQFTVYSPIFLFEKLLTPTISLNQNEHMTEKFSEQILFDPGLIQRIRFPVPPIYFVCRRQNWSDKCHLMQATKPAGKSIYLGFGGGDIIPFQLDAAFTINKSFPGHLLKLTYLFSDQDYASAKTILVANVPYVVAVTSSNNVPVQYMNFSIQPAVGTTDVQMTTNQKLQFPTDILVAGQASTSLTSIATINTALGTGFTDTGNFMSIADDGTVMPDQQFQLVPYNNLVYLVRAVSNTSALGLVGGIGVTSGLLIDTFVPNTTGSLSLAQGARYKRSGLSFFGSSYTPTTMVDSLDTLDFTSITGNIYYAPTIFIPIPEIDAAKGFVADISNFLGQQAWTFIYPEIFATKGITKNGILYDDGYNIDGNGKPILILQRLHFVYDPLVVLFTPNDLSHKYRLQPKQQILALTNSQIQEAICWRSANVQPQRQPPTNVSAQQILPADQYMDRPNIIYSPQNRPVITKKIPSYMGMSLNSFVGVSATVYSIEESALQTDQTATKFISQVSSTANMLVGVLFDYDNNDIGTLVPYTTDGSTKGVVFLNGYLSGSGYAFSSPDHFDIGDVLISNEPLLAQVADTLGFDAAFYNTDVSLPQQFWSLTYDIFTAVGVPNYISNVPPSRVDPNFTNRTRSLILSLQNQVQPDQIGLMDTYSSVVSANLHLTNNVTGSIFLNKKADRNISSIGSNPGGGTPSGASYPLYGLPKNYDFFLFSRDHYGTLAGASFQLIDQGYAMCLIDDGTGTGTQIASYYIDSDGNYYELFSYVAYSPNGGVIESVSFTMKVILGTPANIGATPSIPQTPNNVNPQTLANVINANSNLVYAVFGASTPGQAPAILPIQSATGASPILGPPGFNGYSLNVVSANRQPLQISNIYSGGTSYPIAGSTTIRPINTTTGQNISFYGSLSHGLDQLVDLTGLLYSADMKSWIPRPAGTTVSSYGTFGGNGLGGLINTGLSCAFQGSAPVPPATAADQTQAPGSVMPGDDFIYYTFNAVLNTVVDSNGYLYSVTSGQYFLDATSGSNPAIYITITLPYFVLNGTTYNFSLSSTLPDGVTSRYSLVVGGQSILFNDGNTSVTVDKTTFTFNAKNASNVYTVTRASVDAPTSTEAPATIQLFPFTVTGGGMVKTLDIFNSATALDNILLGVTGRSYTINPVSGTVNISQNGTTTTVSLLTGLTFTPNSGFGYAIGYSNNTYTVNGSPVFPYNAQTQAPPASLPLMTAPQMFTLGGNFYTFDRNPYGGYISVTGNGQIYPVNPYQFSILGVVYIINSNVQPYTVIGGGNTYTMTANNTQFLINGVQYTITYRQNSLYLATISGQYNITQGNVVILESYVYELDTYNGQIIGNGTTYPLTTSGITYTITTLDHSFTVTTEANATTVTIANIVYSIGSSTVVGDGVIYPILKYRGFNDNGTQFVIGPNGIASVPPPIALVGSTFTDGTQTYTVYDYAAFDGTTYYHMTGSPAQFTVGTVVYTIRDDAVSITTGSSDTYILNSNDSPSQFPFGSQTVTYLNDMAAFDGTRYYAITINQFTDSNTGLTYTISGNTAVNEGNSYEVYSNLGQEPYFQVPSGPTYYINIPVADFGSPSGDELSVFPISGGQFTIPVTYTITVAGTTVTIASATYKSGPTAVSSLNASGGLLTGGYFIDPVTQILYTCEVNGSTITFIDSNNAVFPYPPPSGPANTFVALVVVTTGVEVAVDNEATPMMFPTQYNQFNTGSATYSINVPVAYTNAAGPYYTIVNGQFIVPMADPISNISYTVGGSSVTKGYVISNDDEFSIDGNVVYTINAVNVVKASNQATLTGTEPSQIVLNGATLYSLNTTTALATAEVPGVNYNTTTKKFTINYNGVNVTYTLSGTIASDNRSKVTKFNVSFSGTQATFKDYLSTVTFTFDDSGNNPINAGFVYSNHFFIDLLQDVTYYIDEKDSTVEVISYLPETTQYAFVPANGQTYIIHYNNVGVVFPVISGPNVNAGIANVGSDIFSIFVDEVIPTDGSAPTNVNLNSFEINGDLYTIMGTPVGANYSSCQVVGARMSPTNFLTANTFKLRDQSVTYTLQLNSNNLPSAVVANFVVRPSRDLLNINNNIFLITYNTVTTGSLLGQGSSSIAITNSQFTLYNKYDSSSGVFTFADLNIYDAASVVGQYTSYFIPSFFIGNATYTLDTVKLTVTDNNKEPYPLIPNPSMFSIGGSNYVIDTNQTPHAIIGNNNISPLATDVTVQSGHPLPNSTFTLNGQVYKYTEDAHHGLLTITGTQSYMIAQAALTFTLDSGLRFTVNLTPPQSNNYPGTIVPLGTVTAAGNITCNIYAGIPESGNADFFTYNNLLYTFVKSGTTYVAIQNSYTVYATKPTTNQQQLAIFDLAGQAYIVTTGTTANSTSPLGINPGTLWASTTPSNTEVSYGLVYGFTRFPTSVIRSQTPPTTGMFQFMATDANNDTTLYDITYMAGSNSNAVQVDVPRLIPSFTQIAPFDFVPSFPLTIETGGYNAFTQSVAESNIPYQSFAAAYRTPVTSTDSKVDNISTAQGDFSVEFWHSLPLTSPSAYHPFTYSASTNSSLVYYVDVDFESESSMFIQVNNTVMTTSDPIAPILFGSTWQHFALTYTQPNTILCQGAGYEVKDGSNYDFRTDFSVAMTFSVSDNQTTQGLLYKGTGSRTQSAGLAMSYSVTVSGGTVNLNIQDSNGQNFPYTGPKIDANTYYDLIIVKSTNTGTGSGTDPYAPPFDLGSQLSSVAETGVQVNIITNKDGSTTLAGIQLPQGTDPSVPNSFTNNLPQPATSYTINISIRTVKDGGLPGVWSPAPAIPLTGGNPTVNSTGNAHLLIGAAFDNSGTYQPLGGPAGASTGNIRKLYLFNSAIDTQGQLKQTSLGPGTNTVDISLATAQDLRGAGIVAFWRADYDPNGIVYNSFDPSAVALSMNSGSTVPYAGLAGITSHELDGTALFINGNLTPLTRVTNPPSSMVPYSAGSPLLNFNAGLYKLAEISIWALARQPYQIIDDMFGRLIPGNEPLLVIYLSGSFNLKDVTGPALPMSSYVDNIEVKNAGSLSLQLSNASLDLQGCPAVGRCGPLITPNLYTPPGIALIVCDTVPYLTTYSITINSVTDPSDLAGEINEAYVYINNGNLTLYAGKKVGDLVLSWVSQEQGEVQLMGYIEGPPPCPMANMTNRPAYPGATSVTLNIPNSVSLKYTAVGDYTESSKLELDINQGINIGLKLQIAPFGLGIQTGNKTLELQLADGISTNWTSGSGITGQQTSSEKLEESRRYTVKMQGTPTVVTGDLFMANLNAQITPNSTPGNPSARTAILPNPNVGGFTTSNPPSALPRGPQQDEKFGSRMYQPSPYGQAFVTSETLDVYQQTLVQSNTVYGFVRVKNPQIPRDLNIVSFRMSSKYIRPGCLDGVIGYAYNPATLATGEQTYKTSTGQLQVLYDKNFPEEQAGNEASYMRIAEAYQIKKQIDQQALNGIGIYQAAFNTSESAIDSRLTPSLDFYNEYVWSSRGGTQEVKHTYTTSYDEVLSVSSSSGGGGNAFFNAKVACIYVTVVDAKFSYQSTNNFTNRYSYNTTGSTSFDVSASFDGIDTDTQMRYGCANDAHYVMNLNSTFNPNNESGLNLVVGSDGLVYNIVPSVASGAGLPTSDNIDDSQTYTQPPPIYSTGNADGLTGNLEPYDRPGKTNLFRTYQFFLQPTKDNNTTFWNTVVDPVWLANSQDADAVALRTAQGASSIPWRLLWRVTYSERFLPPVTSGSFAVPQITPIMAVPVHNLATDFLFQSITNEGPRPANNPANDIQSNIVLAIPTVSGLSAGSIVPQGSPNPGSTVLPNNTIPFDLVSSLSSIVSWGDFTNARLLSKITASVQGTNIVTFSPSVAPGSKKVTDVIDPFSSAVIYSVFTDPNGLTVNVALKAGLTVYQDVNANPIQYYDGKSYHSLQADYVPSPDGTIMLYIEPPSDYDQSTFDLVGDYDLFGKPGDQWRYYLVSGFSSNMTGNASLNGSGPFLSSGTSTAPPPATGSAPGFTGFEIPATMHAATTTTGGGGKTGGGQLLVQGYVLVQGVLQYPHLNTNSETFADVLVYKALSLLDTYPIGDVEVLVGFLASLFPGGLFGTGTGKGTGTGGSGTGAGPVAGASGGIKANEEIKLVMARNIISYFNGVQSGAI